MLTEDSPLRTILLILAVLLAFPFLMMLFLVPMMAMWGGGHMWDGGMWGTAGTPWMWLIAWLIPLVVLVGLGYLLYTVVSHGSDRKSEPAIEELRVAYARGELSDEEYEARFERLKGEQ